MDDPADVVSVRGHDEEGEDPAAEVDLAISEPETFPRRVRPGRSHFSRPLRLGGIVAHRLFPSMNLKTASRRASRLSALVMLVEEEEDAIVGRVVNP